MSALHRQVEFLLRAAASFRQTLQYRTDVLLWVCGTHAWIRSRKHLVGVGIMP